MIVWWVASQVGCLVGCLPGCLFGGLHPSCSVVVVVVDVVDVVERRMRTAEFRPFAEALGACTWVRAFGEPVVVEDAGPLVVEDLAGPP